MSTIARTIIGLLLLGGLVAGSAWYFFFVVPVANALSPTYNVVELVSSDNQKLYIKSKNWGVSADKQVTVITTDDEVQFQLDSTRDIIFRGLEPFLYRASNDTLFLVLREAARVPEAFISGWTVIQTEVDNPRMMLIMRDPEVKRM